MWIDRLFVLWSHSSARKKRSAFSPSPCTNLWNRAVERWRIIKDDERTGRANPVHQNISLVFFFSLTIPAKCLDTLVFSWCFFLSKGYKTNILILIKLDRIVKEKQSTSAQHNVYGNSFNTFLKSIQGWSSWS